MSTFVIAILAGFAGGVGGTAATFVAIRLAVLRCLKERGDCDKQTLTKPSPYCGAMTCINDDTPLVAPVVVPAEGGAE